MMCLNGEPQWTIVVTHIPSGIKVVRTAAQFRRKKEAVDSAMRYLRSRLYWEDKCALSTMNEVSITELPNDTFWPVEVSEFRLVKPQ